MKLIKIKDVNRNELVKYARFRRLDMPDAEDVVQNTFFLCIVPVRRIWRFVPRSLVAGALVSFTSLKPGLGSAAGSSQVSVDSLPFEPVLSHPVGCPSLGWCSPSGSFE